MRDRESKVGASITSYRVDPAARPAKGGRDPVVSLGSTEHGHGALRMEPIQSWDQPLLSPGFLLERLILNLLGSAVLVLHMNSHSAFLESLDKSTPLNLG
jgi:hypothetical protein